MPAKKPSFKSKGTETTMPGYTLLDEGGHGGWFKNDAYFVVEVPVQYKSSRDYAYVVRYFETKTEAEASRAIMESTMACDFKDRKIKIVVMSAPQLGRYVKRHPETIFSDL